VTAARVPLVGTLALVFALAAGGCARKAEPGQIEAWNAELALLQAEQDSLRTRAAELIAADERIRNLPKGEIVVSVPTAFVRTVVERLFQDVVSRVTLHLGGIKAHAQKEVKKVVTLGKFVVDVDIDRVTGTLRPGKPGIVFGGDRVSLALPVTISEGTGEARIHFVWDGKNIAGLTCGDLDITQKVTGTIIPDNYMVTGALSLANRGRRIVATLQFPETRWRIRVRPSKESWDAIHAILEEKQGVCGWVLDKVNVPALLTNLTEENGFSVKLPLNDIRPIVLPAGVRDSVTVGGRTLSIAARTNSIRIDRDALWFSARVEIEGLDPATARRPETARSGSR
jgi:hypothetical protein